MEKSQLCFALIVIVKCFCVEQTEFTVTPMVLVLVVNMTNLLCDTKQHTGAVHSVCQHTNQPLNKKKTPPHWLRTNCDGWNSVH